MASKNEKPGVAAGLFFGECNAAFGGISAPAWRDPMCIDAQVPGVLQAISAWFQGSEKAGIKTAFRKAVVLLT